MASRTQAAHTVYSAAGSDSKPWNLVTLVAFRFCFVYLGLFALSSQIYKYVIVPQDDDLADLSIPLLPAIRWAAVHVFRVKSALVIHNTGSGDRVVDWITAFWILIISFAVVALWSSLDRNRKGYQALMRWFRLLLRLLLAGQMLAYGFVKVFPLQMPFPSLYRLIEPFGRFSPMGVLWSSIGASPPYEIFTGSVEVAAGLLLILPITATIGTLLALLATLEIFVLNLTYDVPVKLVSLHLVLISLFLLAPDLPRLSNFLLQKQDVKPLPARRLFASQRANSVALGLQALFGLWLICANVYTIWKPWHEYGPGHPRSPLYGIWDLEQVSINGQIRPPLLTDGDRFHRAIFEAPQYMLFEKMDGSVSGFTAKIDAQKHTVALTSLDGKKTKGLLDFRWAAKDQLIVDGEVGGQKLSANLKREDLSGFPLLNRGFHWVEDRPFNR
jgi:hypothetical protein